MFQVDLHLKSDATLKFFCSHKSFAERVNKSLSLSRQHCLSGNSQEDFISLRFDSICQLPCLRFLSFSLLIFHFRLQLYCFDEVE